MYNVLIVDDEMIVRHAVQTLIRWEESRFTYAGSASSGEMALEMARKMNADIIITDIKMPGMDGIELIKQLTAEGFDGEVLVLSNYNDFELVREALRCGAHDYMLKLTLKSEGFMQVLEEMAAKLEERRTGRIGGPSSVPVAELSTPIRIRQRLDTLVNYPAEPDVAVIASKSASVDAWLEPDDRVLLFLVRLMNEGGHAGGGDFSSRLENLADGIFPGSRWAHAVSAGGSPVEGCYLLATAYPPAHTLAEPQELARRIRSVISMYYSVQTLIVHSPPVTGEAAVTVEWQKCRAAESLFFYGQAGLQQRPNEDQPTESGEAFQRAKDQLLGSLRKTAAGSIEGWADCARKLVTCAREQQVAPRVLKQALAGGIWQLTQAEVLGNPRQWDETPWLEKISAAVSDDSLLELIDGIAAEATERAGSRSAYPHARTEVRRALHYLDERYAERFAIADIASHVGLSEPYLCQVFKAETGKSILSYLNEIRMLKAYDLLASGEYLVKQAAAEVGIQDPFYFNRLFKKQFGIAPKKVK